MKQSVLLFLSSCIFLGMMLSGCELTGDDGPVKVPEPEIVEAQELPEYIYTLDNFYYQVRTDPNSEKWEEGVEPILKELLVNDIHLEKAWFPLGVTRCMTPNAFEALVVELGKEDDRIMEFDFIAETDSLVLNCGIEEFEFYSFD